MNRTIFKTGETVLYKPNFGAGAPTTAIITAMDLTDRPRSTSGKEVDEATLEQVNENRVLFTLDDNSWCYSEQIVHVDRF